MSQPGDNSPQTNGRKVRYAVVGLGWIAQEAILPGFKNAAENSVLTAVVSQDPLKLNALGDEYKVDYTYTYDEYDECLKHVDAVYIALPNSMHKEYTIRAAKAGVHVLCEKPMAVTEQECGDMIQAAQDNNVKLMIAYRLHFDEANLKAIEVVQSGQIGEPRIFNSVFTNNVKEGNIRLKRDMGGGPLYDIGIYCINAARYLFRDEPVKVFATSATSNDPRFKEVEEMTSVIMRFPGDRLASFTVGFGEADVTGYQIVGTKGDLRLESAYSFDSDIKHFLTVEGQTKEQTFPRRDQFGPELVYFSNCILHDKQPEPSGEEGLLDVHIIRALFQSTAEHRPIQTQAWQRERRPSTEQEITRPPVKKPELVHSEAPSKHDDR